MRLRPNREWPGLIALAALYVFLALAAPRFFAAENLRDLALSNVSVLLVAMAFVLVNFGVDLLYALYFYLT